MGMNDLHEICDILHQMILLSKFNKWIVPYPLTAPAVIPSIRVRCMKK